MASSTTRIMGMASGLDTESIIQQTMKLTQMKIDARYRAKTSLVWKQEAMTSIKNDIESFRQTYLSTLGSMSMRKSTSYNATVASLSGANSDAVSIKTSYNSAIGTIKIGQIESLAKGANASSTKVNGRLSADNNGFKSDTKIGDMKFASGSEMTFTEVTDEDDPNFGKDVAKVTVNGKEFTFTSDTTLDNMMKTINNSDAGVTMSYDRMADSFKLESKTVGSDAGTLTFSGLEALGLEQSNVENGSKARVEINGEWVESDTNTFDFRGVSITLNRTTAAGDEDTVVTLKRDATEVLDKIKKFVEAYNTLVAKLEGSLKERKNSTEATYTPRTEEELKEMTENQINDWNKVAKKGLLYGDSGLQKLTNSLRGALFESVEAAGLSASQIGLSTGSYFDGKGGQIALDEEKLIAAIEKDPEQVMNAFMGIAKKVDENGNEVTDYSKSGLVLKLDNIMNNYVGQGGSQRITLENLQESIRRAQEQIDKMTTKMYEEEEKLYAKYAALETAMSNLNSQTSNFSALLGG